MAYSKDQIAKLKKEIATHGDAIWSKTKDATTSDNDRELVLKIVNQCSVDDLERFINANEIPSLKLAPQEMESLKGGSKISTINKVLKFIIEWIAS